MCAIKAAHVHLKHLREKAKQSRQAKWVQVAKSDPAVRQVPETLNYLQKLGI